MNAAAESRSHLLVTGLFGDSFSRVHEAPGGVRSVCFSNNEALRPELEAKGWEFAITGADGLALTSDYRVSSLQSKYVKFLQFLADFPHLDRYTAITYVDHKFQVQPHHLRWIVDRLEPGKSVLLRNTPKEKLSIAQEVRVALRQPRYAAAMRRTLEWIARMKAERGAVEDVRIVNTGLIHYACRRTVLPMLDEVFRVVNELGQPECQIVWAILSQPYEHEIQRVAWSELCPIWRAP